jgi:[pyruvate, phosphate dikinase]-phosphate phosphotransferase / [pyruvate, phosphate dikinase] kinase
MSAVSARTFPAVVPRTCWRPTKHRRASTTVAATRGGDASSDESAKAAATERELREARVRAERMAVRLKLRSVVAGPGSVGVGANKGARKKSLDAAIAETRTNAKSEKRTEDASGSRGEEPPRDLATKTPSTSDQTLERTPDTSANTNSFIEDERSAVRLRLEKYSMNRYAFVVRGERKGRVVDRVTGADVSDDAENNEEEKKLSTQDKLDLARERVKQAEQECANARDAETAAAAAAARRVDDAARALEARRATLSSLAAEAAKRAEGEEHTASAEARRALRATLDVMDAAGAVKSAVKSSAAGAGARKSATRRGEDEASGSSVSDVSENTANLASSVPDAKTRAADAIRARASSSLSRLRKQRRIKRAGSARRSTSQSVANSTVDGVAAGAELALEPPGSFFTNSSDESGDTSLSLSFGDTSSGDGVNGGGALILDTALPKPIFVLSDCTGESAANTCRAALTQFAEVMNLSAPTNLYVFRFLSEGSDAYKICEQAKEDDALVVYTLSDASLATAVATACKVFGVKSVNLWGPLLVAMEEHLAMQRTGVPMSSDAAEVASVSNKLQKKSTRKVHHSHGDTDVLSTDYYRMIEAVEFTRQMDDGARPDKWRDADILILGVSRTGKTPLSIYLGQRGYKVANLPLVPRDGQLMVPSHIDDIDPKRVFGLLIDGEVLHSIRANRLRTIGVGGADASAREYAAARVVNQELALAKALYARHPEWQILDVTHKGVEETAARIMKLMYQSEDANNFLRMRAT